MAVCDAIVPFELRTTRVAQKAKEVLVEPVLLLIYKVKGFVIVEPGVQVSQGLLGRVALTNNKSPDVHEFASGNVWAIAMEEKSVHKIIQKNLKDWHNEIAHLALAGAG